MTERVDFDTATAAAFSFMRRHLAQLGSRTVLIRNLRGQFRILAEKKNLPQCDIGTLSQEFQARLGAYGGGDPGPIFTRKDLFAADTLFDSPDILELSDPDDPTAPIIRHLDHAIMGADWLRTPGTDNAMEHPHRVVFYGVKGGVGRSTALAGVAWYLAARLGKRVLVVDLDLESPGVGGMLLPMDRIPSFGLIDWLAEDAADNQPERLVQDMTAPSPLSGQRGGMVRVAPAAGNNPDNYLVKLSRAYLSEGRTPQRSFAARLHRLLTDLEAANAPDITLIDSRAGLHDIAAVALTHLDAEGLLFAQDSPQTWAGFGALFTHLRSHRRLAALRERFKMVASMVPAVDSPAYLAKFRENAHTLWSNTLYETDSNGDGQAFNFDIGAEDAPHHPLPIPWLPQLQAGIHPNLEPEDAALLDPLKPLNQWVENLLAPAEG
ncbi:MAG: hypothetical protein HQL82_12000 [Magnetococcales bacterium]|nr:hypothetical protein [Magnetococcales bacterium]